jgi:hypothetical protein
MFPSFNFDDALKTIEQTTSNESDSITLDRVFLMEFEGNKAKVVIENGKPVEAKTTKVKVEMYAQMLLRTELDKYNVYKDTDFGMTYFKYRGNRQLPVGFINSELKREISEKLTKLSVVDSVSDFSAKISEGTLDVEFTIHLIDDESTVGISEVI